MYEEDSSVMSDNERRETSDKKRGEYSGKLICQLKVDRGKCLLWKQPTKLEVTKPSSYKIAYKKQLDSNGAILVTDDGFTFDMNFQLATTHWHCNHRFIPTNCPARMIEIKGEFIPNGETHNHPPYHQVHVKRESKKRKRGQEDKVSIDARDETRAKPITSDEKMCNQNDSFSNVEDSFENLGSSSCNGNEKEVFTKEEIDKLKKCIKLIAMENPYSDAKKIVGTQCKILNSKSHQTNATVNTPPQHLLKYCQKILDKKRREIKENSNFFRIMNNDGKPYLICATDQQLNLLSLSKTWYIDMVSLRIESYTHLLSISSFVVDNEGILKHSPLIFVFMSSQKRSSFACVFMSILEVISYKLSVNEFVTDFNPTLWQALNDTFESPYIHGCALQWNKRLKTEAFSHNLVEGHKRLALFFGLNLLPADEISDVFTKIFCKLEAQSDLKPLLEYFRTHYIENSDCDFSLWSSFQSSVRTKEDVKEWQEYLASLDNNLQLSAVVSLLENESAKRISSSSISVSGKKLLKVSSKRSVDNPRVVLDSLWKSYLSQEFSSWKLLRRCVELRLHTWF